MFLMTKEVSSDAFSMQLLTATSRNFVDGNVVSSCTRSAQNILAMPTLNTPISTKSAST